MSTEKAQSKLYLDLDLDLTPDEQDQAITNLLIDSENGLITKQFQTRLVESATSNGFHSCRNQSLLPSPSCSSSSADGKDNEAFSIQYKKTTKREELSDESPKNGNANPFETQIALSTSACSLPFSEEKIIEIQVCIDQKDYVTASKKCNILLGLLNHSEIVRPDITHRLQKMNIMTRLLSREVNIKFDYKTATREQFIDLNLSIAQAITYKKIKVTYSEEVELVAYRQAAQAGSAIAQLHLINTSLFCKDCKSYLPFAAVRFLLQLSLSPQNEVLELLDTSSPFNNAINDLVLLLKTKTQSEDNQSSQKLRDSIAEKLCRDPNPMIKMLVPFIYSTPEFGAVSLENAMSYLDNQHGPFISGGDESVNNICAYWKIICDQKPIDELRLTALVKKGILAALFSLSEAARWSGDRKKCLQAFSLADEGLLPSIYLSPDLCHSLVMCHSNFPLPLPNKKPINASRTTLLQKKQSAQDNIADKLYIQAVYFGFEPTLFNRFSTDCKKSLYIDNLQKINHSAIVKPPDDFTILLEEHRFSLFPTVLLFTHIQQYLNAEIVDDSLIEKAMEISPLTTSLSMLFIGYFTSKYNYSTLVNLVWSNPDITLRSFDLFIEDNIQKLLNSLSTPNALFFSLNPSRNYKLIGQVRQAHEKIHGIKATVVFEGINQSDIDYYSRYLALSGDELSSKRFSYRHTELDNQKEFCRDPEEDFALISSKRFRRIQPEYHLQLRDIQDSCEFPEDNDTNIEKLKLLYETAMQEPDPEFAHKLANILYNFLRFSPYHTSKSQFCDLLIKYKELVTRALTSSNHLISIAISDIKNKANQFIALSAAQNFHALQDSLTLLTRSLQDSAQPMSDTSQAIIPQVLKTPFRLPVKYNSLSLYTEHKLIKEITEEEEPSQKLALMSQVVKTSLYCPLTLLQQFPTQFNHLAESDQQQAITILDVLTNELSARQTLVEIDNKKITGSSLALKKRFLEVHSLLHNNSDFHEEYENELLNITVRQCTQPVIENVILTDIPIEGYSNGYKGCSCSHQEQFEMLMKSIPQPMDIIAWVDTVKPKLTIHELTSIKASLDKSDTEFKLKHLVAHYLSSNEKSIRFLDSIKRITPTKRLDYAKIIHFALLAKIISNKQGRKYQKKLPAFSIPFRFLNVHLDDNPAPVSISLISEANINDDLSIKYTFEDIFPSIGLKLLEHNQIKLSTQCFELTKEKYSSTLLSWKHPIDGVAIPDIPQALLVMAAHGNVQAQCRIIDWHLEHRNLHQNDVTRSCRYLLTPHYIYSPEKEFYQGLVWYLGIRVDEDENIAKSHFEIAFAHKSPIPCLRLLILKEKKLFNSDEIECLLEGGLLETFAEKFLKYDHDVFPEMLSSCSMEEISLVITALRNYTNDLESTNSYVEHAFSQLCERVDDWKDRKLASLEAPFKLNPKPKLLSSQKLKPIKHVQQLMDEINSHAKELLQSATSTSSTSKQLVEALTKLSLQQGKDFPKLDVDYTEWFHILFTSIELNYQNINIIKRLFRAIHDDKKNAVMVKVLNYILPSEASIETIQEHGFIQARDLLITLLPSDFNIQTCSPEVTSRILQSYGLDNQHLPKNLIHAFKQAKAAFLQSILLEQTLQTSSFTELYEIYFQMIELPDEALLERAFKTPPLRLTCLKLLCQYYPHTACNSFSINRTFESQYKLSLFVQLTFHEKQALLNDTAHGENLKFKLADTVFINFKNSIKAPRKHSVDIATKLLTKQANIKQLLTSYFEIEKLASTKSSVQQITTKEMQELQEEVRAKLIVCSNDYLVKGLQHSEGESWLLAVAIDSVIGRCNGQLKLERT